MATSETKLDRLASAIYRTWDQIAPDAMEFVDDNVCAIEMCLDADRLLLNGEDPEAHALAREIGVKYGFSKLCEYLSKHVHLV
jgi:hypothetical protein